MKEISWIRWIESADWLRVLILNVESSMWLSSITPEERNLSYYGPGLSRIEFSDTETAS